MKSMIVWGSAGEIGRAVVDHFRDQGWWVGGVVRSLEGTEARGDQVAEADFTDPEQVRAALEKLTADRESVDVYLYAGGDILSEKVAGSDPERWEEIIANNLTGVYQTLRVSLPVLEEGAHIFILGAVSERLLLPGLSAYAAAKAGVEALAVSLSKEERRKKVTVVRPGAVATAFWDKVPFRQPADATPPPKLAGKIWEAYQEGHRGQLDLV